MYRHCLRSLIPLLLLFFGGILNGQTFAPVRPLFFVKHFGGADPLPQILTVTNTGSNFDFDTPEVMVTGSTHWLSVAMPGFNCCATPRAGVEVTVTTPAAMAAGTYTGQIKFTSFGGATSMVVPVTLRVEAAAGTFFNDLPGALSFALKTHGTTIANQTIQIRNGGSGSLNWSLAKSTADGGNWLTVSAATGKAPSLTTVGISVTNLPGGGLVPGHFTGQLLLSQSAGGGVSIPVSVTVGDNIFTQINGLNFTKFFGEPNPLPQTLTVASTGTNFDFVIDSFTANGGSWLSVQTPGFNCCATPRALAVKIGADPTLPIGTYTGEVVFTAQGNGSMAIAVPVTLTVQPVGDSLFNNLPGALSFALKTGGAVVPDQQIQVANGGSEALTWNLSKSTSDGGDWLTVSESAGTAPSVVTVGVAVANLPGGGLVTGEFIGQLVFSQPSGANVTIPICVTVGANIFGQINGLNFTKAFGGADPLPQSIVIPSTGSNFDFDINSFTANGGDWLAVQTPGFNCCATPRALPVVVSADPTLPVGVYTGEIVVTAEGNGAMAITVPVTLTIEASTSPLFASLPGQLSFALKTGGTTITSQTIQIRNGGTGTLSWSAAQSTSDGGHWLTVSAASGTAPSQVTIGVSVNNLPGGGLITGHFIGQVVLSQASGGRVTIPVSVTVGANIFTQINGLNFTKVFGGPNPLPQTVTVPSTGTNFDFVTNSFTSGGGNWLTVGVVGFNCCATPRALPIKINADPVLPAGTYTGEVIFTEQGSGNMSVTVPVTLTVEPANATFLDDVQGQLSFSLTPGSGNPAAQDVQIRKRGSGSLAWTLAGSTADGGNWLTLSETSGSAPATAHVGVIASALPGAGLVAGTFVGNLVLSSATSTTTIPVSVVVGTKVFVEVPTLTFTKAFGGANSPPKNVTIASTGGAFDFDNNWYNATGGNWLSVTVAGFNCCATPRAITANIVADPNLAAGTYTGQIVVTAEGNGAMAMTIPVILSVTSSKPIITAVSPNTGEAGQTIPSVVITAQNTNFVQGTTLASFGAGVTVNSLTVNSATKATANITIQSGAAAGARTVTLTTASEVASLPNGFTVSAPLDVVSFNALFGSQSYNLLGITRNRLPWQVTGIRVVFNKSVTAGSVKSLTGVSASSLTGLGTNTLTWTFSPLMQASVAAALSGSGPNALTDSKGVALRGGAGYSQTMRVLLGDFNDDGVVTAPDMVGVNNASMASYNPLADINGDGTVNVADVQAVRARLGTSLP